MKSRLIATVKPCGVDWQAVRVWRTERRLAFYGRVLRACQERFRQLQKESKDGMSDDRNTDGMVYWLCMVG